MKCSANSEKLLSLYETVNNWQQVQARSEEGVMSYDEYEEQMDNYLNTLEEFEDIGVRKIGEGRDRITFTSGDIVSSPTTSIIKVSKSGGGSQNVEEVELWKQLDEKVRKNVAWLIDWDPKHRWIIQERVSQLSSPSATQAVLEKLEDKGWTCSDVRPENVGKRESTDNKKKRPKEPVLMDLGVGLRRI